MPSAKSGDVSFAIDLEMTAPRIANGGMLSTIARIKRLLRPLKQIPQAAPHLRLKQKGVLLGRKVQTYGLVRVDRYPNSEIRIGAGVVLNARANRNTLEARGPVILKTIASGAYLLIGEDTGITSGTISAASGITIGRRVLIGAGVLITDSDHHVVQPGPMESRRFLGLPSPSPIHQVDIGDDVFIGARAMILKGVTVGQGSVIGAGSVVTRDIPPFVIAAGNPCVVIRELGTL